ncbi:MAG: HAMP domain-containing histidine kinase [Candidatus Hydrogenedentes bacterium]|nr:HAMP domain-containing histidine kinase [Candidatus Hydrogenedentota bacterium]
MNYRLLILLVLMIAVPLAVLTWLGVRLQAAERATLDDFADQLHTEELRGFAQSISTVVQQTERDIQAKLDSASIDPNSLRRLLQESPHVTQFFRLDDNVLLYPAFDEYSNASEEEFLLRTRDIWRNGELMTQSPPEELLSSSIQSVSKTMISNVALNERPYGWYVWHWGSDIHLLLWTRRTEGIIIGAELNRPRLVSEIIAALPGIDPDEILVPSKRIELRNSREEIIYTFGPGNAASATQLRAELPLEYPLNTWSLSYFVNPEELAASIEYAPAFWYRISTQVGAIAVVLIALAIYLYRENARSMREAAQRVTFVNQVSHELKTPLTNIRMYAEMLEEDLDASDDQSRRHVGVLVSESQRLSRLIANILTFNRKERHALKLRPAPGIVDDCVQSVIAQFRPALDSRGISITTDLNAAGSALIDADAIGQIVGNLVSNVEKYAATGKQLSIRSKQIDETVTISVTDAGPGIPTKERAHIFNAFYRISDKLTDGVAGTGIGLTIARELARLHGGDLVLRPSQHGAHFVVTLHCPPAGDSA